MDRRVDPRRQLCAMVGVRPGANVEELRAGYERAIRAATRSEDYRLARALSDAFDRLPLVERQQLYRHPSPQVQIPSAPRQAVQDPTLRQCDVRCSWRSRVRLSRETRTRLLIYLVLAPAAVVLGVAVGVHHQKTADSDQVLQPRSYTPPVASTLRIPKNAPAGRHGLVLVLCQPNPGAAGYLTRAAPGALVTCVNGAAPQVIANR